MGWLSLVKGTGLKKIIWPNRHYWLLLIVSIQIAKNKIERAIAIPLPSFKNRLNILATRPASLAVRQAASANYKS
jgi:hypothetical protein